MASAPSVSKKRKRDDGDSCPRITYFAEGRTFERLFREETLDETLKVVQHKLGLDDDTLVILSQIRGEQSIDLDDEDDFEAFQALAYKTMAMSVRVRTKPKPKATTPTTHIAHQATQSTPSSHAPAQSSLLASEIQRPPPLTQPQASSSIVTTQTPTAQIAPSAAAPSVTTLPNGSQAPATEPIKRKPGRPKKVTPVYQPPALPDAPSASAQTAPAESTSTALSSSRVQLPSQDTSKGTEQPPPKRQKRATIVEKAVVNPDVPSQQKAGPSASSPTEAPASQAAIVPSAGPSATQTTPNVDTTTKPKTKKKRAAETQNTEAPPASAPVPQEQVVDVATTSESAAPPKRRKTHKSRVLISETPEPSDSSEAPPAPATQPPKLIPEDPTSTSAPVKKVKKSSKKDNVESATAKVAASATAPEPPVAVAAEESASAPVRKSKRTSVREADNAENSNVRVITHSTGPSTTKEKTTKAAGKKKAEISIFETLTDIACPICLGKPFHVRESCPIVLAGWRVLEPRLKELKEDDVYHSLIKSLEADIKKMKGKSTAKDAAQPQASTSISTERTTRTSAKAPIPSSKDVALTNGLVGSSTKASQRPDKTQSKSSGLSATKSATVAFDTPLADVDISSINPEDLLKNPNSSRLAISDIESMSDDDDKDESPNDAILEEDSDNDAHPRTRLRRTRSQTKLRRRALDSSDDEDNANMAMDVDSPVSELHDIPLGVVDKLGQSQELDRRPDDLLSQIARSENVVPTIRASIEVEKDSLSAPESSLPSPILTQVPSGNQIGLPTPDQSSTPTSQNAAADLPPPSQVTNGDHDKSKADPSETTTSHSQDQSSSAIQPTTSKQALSQIVSPSAESSQPRPLDSSQTSPKTPAPKRNGHTKLSEAEKPQSNSKASSSKTKVAKDGKTDEKKIEKKGEKKTGKKGEKKSEKKSEKKGEKKDEKKPAKPVDKIPDPSSPMVDVDEGQSLAQWEILPRSESPPMDRSSQGVDELEGQDFDSVVASTPRNPIPPKDPLFLPTDSQFPAYPQTQSSQITARSPAESDDEAEVAEVVKRDHSRTSSSATAYRGLSAIASQRLFTSTIIRPPRFSLPRHANALSAKKKALYGEDEKSSSSSGEDSDDSTKAPSHIPQGKRAGAK
ncbi:hypothetical protein ONZ45_g941 [Pleurotus djamor]|nr:hypothetical protein ONZ45_g941 [Pleurotus djamor]